MRNFSTVVDTRYVVTYEQNDVLREVIIFAVCKHMQINRHRMTPAEERTIDGLISFMDCIDRKGILAKQQVYLNMNLNTGATYVVLGPCFIPG